MADGDVDHDKTDEVECWEWWLIESELLLELLEELELELLLLDDESLEPPVDVSNSKKESRSLT